MNFLILLLALGLVSITSASLTVLKAEFRKEVMSVFFSSDKPRFALLAISLEHVRNLQTVLFNPEADVNMRRSALRQLQTNATKSECLESRAVLEHWRESGLTLD